MPGVLRARRGQRPRLAADDRDQQRRRLGDQRREALDQLRAPRQPVRRAGPHRRACRVRGASAPSWWTWTRRASPASPLRTMAGVDEFCSTSFVDVAVPGGAAARRSTAAGGSRSTSCPASAARSSGSAAPGSLTISPSCLGRPRRAVAGAAARPSSCCGRSAPRRWHAAPDRAGDLPGPEASVDKIMIAAADQAVFDTARELLRGGLETDDSRPRRPGGGSGPTRGRRRSTAGRARSRRTSCRCGCSDCRGARDRSGARHRRVRAGPLAATLRGLAEDLDGAELTKALDAFGFAELLAEAPRVAVSALFTAMGRAGSISPSMQDVLLQPLAVPADGGRNATSSCPASAPRASAAAAVRAAAATRPGPRGAPGHRRCWRRSAQRRDRLGPGAGARGSRPGAVAALIRRSR